MFSLALALMLTPASEPAPWDRARNVVDQMLYDRLEEMHQAGLESARVATAPWSDSYWPFYAGGIAIRYLDPEFPREGNWATYSRYILSTIGKRPLEILSPAEKYDLLIGDPNFTLTRQMAGNGARFSNGGEVAKWMGYCHGWAPASFMYPRPVHSVNALAADGKTTIEFLPSDIKALGTLLWAKSRFPMRFIGKRCRETPPRRDDHGRPTTPACQDTNAATWHLAVVNQIGVAKRSLIMDSGPDGEVWNFPVSGYRFSYFNPATDQPVTDMASARIALREFPQDRFKGFRAAGTVAVIGINMDVTYTSEDFPSALRTDSPAQDKVATAQFKYDLELDAEGRIIGGEWHSDAKPDFLWVPLPQAHPRAASEWDGSLPLPDSWTREARADTSSGKPYAPIVESLFERASSTAIS